MQHLFRLLHTAKESRAIKHEVWLLQVLQMYRPPPYPSVQELARPELKLAGAQRLSEIVLDSTPV